MAYPRDMIFFDGTCGFCNFWVLKLLLWDRKAVFSFAPLQGKTAAELLPVEYRQELNSFIYWSEGAIFSSSTAVIEVLCRCFWFGSCFKLFYLIPQRWRDALYGLIARNRMILMKNSSCRILSVQERRRFLD